MIRFALVAAADSMRGIGKSGDLPWRLHGDMAFFRNLTRTTEDSGKLNAVIMGRKTWESIPPRFRPLEHRLNVILTRQDNYDPGEEALLSSSLDQARQLLARRQDVEKVFVVGGGAVYQEAIRAPGCNRVYLTEVEGEFECDTFFPELPPEFKLVSRSAPNSEKGISYRFCLYQSER